MRKKLLITGSIMAALTVIIGAFGSHALKDVLMDTGKTEAFKTGVLYQMFHSMALISTGLLWKEGQKNSLLKLAGYFFIAGIVLFSGSLYLLSAANWLFLGPITPLGGLAFISGWIGLTIHLIKND